jgi:ribosome maturation factor RimP
VNSQVMSALQTDIEGRLALTEPDVEVLLVELVGGRTLRIFIDHPDGVTLGICERVTMRLNDLRELYALEVSSPGSERPLTKPAHFRRFLGHRARVRTHRPRLVAEQDVSVGSGDRHSQDPRPTPARPTRAVARASFTGELVAASEEEVTLAAAGGVIAIPYSEIRRSNLLED